MFTIKQNDTLPFLRAQLIDYEGNPVNLDLCMVYFHMSGYEGNVKVNRPASIIDAVNGIVQVNWKEDDTRSTGTFKCEFEVNMPDGKVISIPNDGYFLISIVPELA